MLNVYEKLFLHAKKKVEEGTPVRWDRNLIVVYRKEAKEKINTTGLAENIIPMVKHYSDSIMLWNSFLQWGAGKLGRWMELSKIVLEENYNSGKNPG